jgi:hypothetical protein
MEMLSFAGHRRGVLLLAVPSMLFLTLVAGCSSASGPAVTTTDMGDASTPRPDAGDTEGPSPCPATLPEAGAACESPSTFCEYGSDPHCASTALCVNAWTVGAPEPSCAGNPSQCPASMSEATNDTPCPVVGVTCTYPLGRGFCVPCTAAPSSDAGADASMTDASSQAGGEWTFGTWPTPAGCPTPEPLAGTPCATDQEECDYGYNPCGPSLGDNLVCTNGYWKSQPLNGACDGGQTVCGH